MAGQSSAEQVLRSAHQLHGAMGFTDEVNLSWLSKASQAVRRLPEPVHRTAAILVEVSGPQGVGMLGDSTTAAR